MKLTVAKKLNVRVGEPKLNAPCFQYLEPGQEVEVEDKLYPGDPYEDNDQWYRNDAGNYFWSGGFNTPDKTGNYPWWIKNSVFSIPELWSEPSLREVKVAILDTGISKHIDFNFTKITGYNYLSNTNDYQSDIYGHGTHLAGIIAASGIKSYGVAPETNLFIAKVCDDYGRPKINAVKEALNDICEGKNGGDGIRVINMSFDLPPEREQDELLIKDIENLINRLSDEKQCIIVCSCGEISDLYDSFPAKMPACIAVGSVNLNLFRSSKSRITPILDIMAPGEAITSSKDTMLTVELSGTSQAAAFVSGVCSLSIQRMKQTEFLAESVKNILFKTAYNNSFSIPEYGHGIINPNKLLETLNQSSI